jgi:hypothetical protein
MFARKVCSHLKSNMLSDHTRPRENEILPLLRKQKGFNDEIALSNPGSLWDVIAISLWKNKASADAHNTNAHPEVLRTLKESSMERPRVQTFEAVTSTYHHVVVAA